MSKKIAPKIIKVTVSNGQTRVIVPKKMALQLNLINEDGEPGKIRHLLVNPHQRGIRLTPLEINTE